MEWRLLQGVPQEEVQRLLALARRCTFRRGEVVFHRDDPADSLHLIVKGRFAIRATTALGDQATIALRGPGENFGEMALVGGDGGGRRSATVEAIEPGETFCLYQADFHRLRWQHPSVTDLVVAFLADEVRMLNARLLEALYIPVDRRVLRRLDELVSLYHPDAGGEVEIPLTQEEIAGLAGTSRATVNTVLGDAQKRGLVELGRGKVHILDVAALAERARRP